MLLMRNSLVLICLIVISCNILFCYSLKYPSTAVFKSSISHISRTRVHHVSPSFSTITIADLDSETLSALGDVQELNDALGDAIDMSNPAANILTKLVDSPFVIAVPIVAGLLVAFSVGFIIFSYGQGRDD